VLIFGFAPVAPALFADDSSNLPACCRRLGAHHCAIQLPAGPAYKGVCSQYGHSPAVLAQPEYAKAAVLKASRGILAAFASRPAAAEQNRPFYRLSFSRSRQKRGPPSLFL
jgi:hypothetical protein